MRHHDKNRSFGRKKDERKALMVGLLESLIIRGKIRTTLAKAKEVRPLIEKLVTSAKKDSLATTRLLSARLVTTAARKRLSKEIVPKFMERKGGYTRITKLPVRKSDASKMALIEFVA